MTKFTIGADPEVFVRKHGKPFSAHGLIPGDKDNPHKVRDGAVQVDGMALEFNIDPCSTFKEFNSRITSVMNQMEGMLELGHSLDISPLMEFGYDYIEAQPDKAKELGCEPDYNAYTGEANPKPDAKVPFRTAAGHIHIGLDRKLSFDEKRKLTILCDIFIGMETLSFDKCEKRRELYGAAGAFRDKPYGIEYRTPSNAWLLNTNRRRRVYSGVRKAVKYLDQFEDIILLLERNTSVIKHYDDLQKIINRTYTGSAVAIKTTLENYKYV